MPDNSRRDIKGDYKAAYIVEYEAHKRAGNGVRAADVASILREHYGHEVAPRKQVAKKAAAKRPERADSKAAENTAEPKPRHTKGAFDA